MAMVTDIYGPMRWSRSRDYLPPTGPSGPAARQQLWYGRSRTPSPPSMKPSPGRTGRRQPPSALNLSHHGPRKKVMTTLTLVTIHAARDASVRFLPVFKTLG